MSPPAYRIERAFAWLAEQFLWRQLAQLDSQLFWLRLKARPLPDLLIEALVAAEDHRFWSHFGIDWVGIARAAKNIVIHHRIEGASTIEQQFVRTLLGRYDRTITRKFTELLIAAALQSRLTKRQIAELYLAIAYFGWRMNGVQQAAARLHIDLQDPHAEHCSLLVAALKYPMPRNMDPSRKTRVFRRADHILKRMNGRGKV